MAARYQPLAARTLAVLAAFSICASAQQPPAFRKIIAAFGGKVTFAARDLKTGRSISVNSDLPVATASVIKLPIMVETFFQVKEGKLRWDLPLTVRHDDKVEGSGILQDLSDDLTIHLSDAVMLMIVESDNTATNLVIDKVGVSAVNQRMQSLGLNDTVLYRKVFRPLQGPASADAKRFGLGKTTANDMLKLVEMIENHTLVDAPACDRMLAILKKQRDIDAFPRYLDQFNPPDTKTPIEVAHKTGSLDELRNDVGIVYTPAGPIAMAGFAYDSPDHRWTCDNAATLTLARLAEATVRMMLHENTHNEAAWTRPRVRLGGRASAAATLSTEVGDPAVREEQSQVKAAVPPDKYFLWP